MFLYLGEHLKGSAAKCNYVVYVVTEFVLFRLTKMKRFPCYMKISVSFSA